MLITPCHELDELGGGRNRATISIKPVAYWNGGSLTRINSAWGNGDATYAHAVTAAKLKQYVKADASRRLHPTGELDRYIEFGPPNVWQVNRWRAVNLGSATRTANRLSWSTATVDCLVTHAGHYTKLDIPLKAGYLPPTGRIAFPITLVGLTLTGDVLYRDGVRVASLRHPYVYDAANYNGKANLWVPTRPITLTYETTGGVTYAVYTLPDTTGMTSPVVDPTLDVTPDATAGKDNSIRVEEVTYNHGAADYLNVAQNGGSYTWKSLISFDLSSLSGATCDTATLYLYDSVDRDSGTDVHVHLLAAANEDWGEGDNTDAAADAGESCWSYAQYDTEAWAGSAGCSTATTDYVSSTMGTLSHGGGVPGTENEITLDTTTVEGEFGGLLHMLLREGDTDAWAQPTFGSSDHSTAAYRPNLVVEYTAGGGDGTLTAGAAGAATAASANATFTGGAQITAAGGAATAAAGAATMSGTAVFATSLAEATATSPNAVIGVFATLAAALCEATAAALDAAMTGTATFAASLCTATARAWEAVFDDGQAKNFIGRIMHVRHTPHSR